jgi:hypothetical protein
MRSSGVVETHVAGNRCLGLAHSPVGFQVNLLVFDAAPESLHKHVVAPATFAVHADLNAALFECVRERLAGELAALVGIENHRRSIPGDRLVKRLQTELDVHRDRHAPGEDSAARPVHHRCELHEPPLHGDVADIHRPHVVGALDGQTAQ